MLKRSYQIQIKQGHKLFSYFETMSVGAKNLYNVTNFYIRQAYTALNNDKELQPLQKEVFDTILNNLPEMNRKQEDAFQASLKKVIKKPKPIKLRKDGTPIPPKELAANTFELPTKEKPFLSYNFLDCLFKVIKQPDYKALPAQSSQGTMTKVYDDWSSFFAARAQYALTPDKFTGKPNIPHYQQGFKEIYFTNQDCVIKDEAFLKFPKTKLVLNIGKLGVQGNLKQVRVIPRAGLFIVECVMDIENLMRQVEKLLGNLMSLDLGVNNFASVVTNTGMTPHLLNGRPLKSMNQYYNKMKAYYTGILREGRNSKDDVDSGEGSFQTKRLQRLFAITKP